MKYLFIYSMHFICTCKNNKPSVRYFSLVFLYWILDRSFISGGRALKMKQFFDDVPNPRSWSTFLSNFGTYQNMSKSISDRGDIHFCFLQVNIFTVSILSFSARTSSSVSFLFWKCIYCSVISTRKWRLIIFQITSFW